MIKSNVKCKGFTATKFAKTFSGSQHRQVVEWRVNQHFENHTYSGNLGALAINHVTQVLGRENFVERKAICVRWRVLRVRNMP
jgi:hypothetical protein